MTIHKMTHFTLRGPLFAERVLPYRSTLKMKNSFLEEITGLPPRFQYPDDRPKIQFEIGEDGGDLGRWEEGGSGSGTPTCNL